MKTLVVECNIGDRVELMSRQAPLEELHPLGRLMATINVDIRGFSAYPDLSKQLRAIADTYGDSYRAELQQRASLLEKVSDAYKAIGEIRSIKNLQDQHRSLRLRMQNLRKVPWNTIDVERRVEHCVVDSAKHFARAYEEDVCRALPGACDFWQGLLTRFKRAHELWLGRFPVQWEIR